uniref:Mitochondria-eating protein n=1 Tax=Syphacia muris TaxID=451379 RepID=A0A158R542_9BILA
MYTYSDQEDEDYLDEDCADRLLKQIQCLKVTTVSTLLHIIPPISQLIKSIPFSLPIFDAVFTRIVQLQNERDEKFPSDEMRCSELFRQLLWWTALNDIAQTSSVPLSSSTSALRPINYIDQTYQQQCTVILKTNYGIHLRTILNIIERECPDVIEKAQKERAFLVTCLDSLGCHGLVNCSTGLIRYELKLFDAIRIEAGNHVERIRSISNRLKEVHRALQLPEAIPSCASHQRQMNLHLSEIFERLKQNEYMENILNGLLSNRHVMLLNQFVNAYTDLNSLLRIVRKRIQSDKMLINVFNFLNKTAPSDFAFDDVDPTIAKLVVAFKNAYDKLLHMISFESDSGYGNESELGFSNCSRSTLKASGLSHLRRFQTTADFYRSLTELQNSKKYNKVDKRVAKSLSRLNISEYAVPYETLFTKTKTHDFRIPTPSPCSIEDDCCVYSTADEIANVTEKYTALFVDSRKEVMEALDCLPEFMDSVELQLKTIFTVVILTYRSVYGCVAKRRSKVYEALDENLPNDNENLHLDFALYRHMYRKAKSEFGMENAKEVTAQIWSTLFDFPSLKTCTRFNRFILECVSVVWDLVTGVDGKPPRMTIDYEGDNYDPEKHQRFQDSSVESSVIQQYIWPALINTCSNEYLCKAFVVT